jgi:putative acetyltransferase
MSLREIDYSSSTDLQAVRDLFREYQASLGLDLGFQNFDEEFSGLPGKYAPPQGALYLFEHEGEPAGCAALRPLSEPSTCELKRLYVRPSARNQRAGHRLVQTMLAQARTLGYRRVLLDTLESMMAARKLYESFGFREITPYYESPLANAIYYAFEFSPHESEKV